MAGTSATAGIGLRPPHLPGLLAGEVARPGWVEIHAETFMASRPGAGSHPRLRDLERLRADLPVSIHGVGLSPGSVGGIDADHLARLADLVDRLEPVLVSEHAAWCRTPAGWIDDLLPVPMTVGALRILADNVCRIQDVLRRPLLIENPSTYLPLRAEMDEPAFLADLVRRTGCGLLLDVNNIVVSAHNLGRDAGAWLAAMPLAAVGEIHIAGHAVEPDPDDPAAPALLIDDHGHPVADPVWDLLDRALAVTGPVPVLLERDTDLPPWAALVAEAARADRAIDRVRP
ncbi:DUF692 domain-containing protein [Tistrella mobilis]|uniref:DUF692 domain-containing protein n=1 Tax=Tistrella mobilis TaxID=171437 RepID=UPI0035565037